MNSPAPSPSAIPPGIDPAILGTSCCIGSAICYTGANICLRQLAGWDVHPAWVIAIKELVTVSVVGPFLVWLMVRGRLAFWDTNVLAVLMVTGVGVQLAGNLSLQWAFGTVGLTVSMPTAMGVMLAASAVIGLVWLDEAVTRRCVSAIVLLTAAISLLAVGTGVARQSGTLEAADLPPLGTALLGVGAAALGGITFAALAAAVRYAGSRKTPVSVIVLVITGMGVVSCGLLSLDRIGLAGMAATPPDRLAWMLASGVFNLLGFLLITKGLQWATLVHANVLNASQVALAVVAGMAFFDEPNNAWLTAGIVLTVVGMFQIGTEKTEEQAVEAAR
ncbi:MAG: EamA family transporter [Thermoguttaceae bacterium]